MTDEKNRFLYESVEEYILSMIKAGSLKIGGKIPSLRRTAANLKISISTAMKAYMELENKGFIEARPKSGYVLVKTHLKKFSEPEPSNPSLSPKPVSKYDLVLQLYKSMGGDNKISFSLAEPSASLLPSGELAKMMRKGIEQTPNHSSYETIGGLPELKKQISYYMFTNGINMPADKMFITSGSLEALYISLRILTKPGDCVILESPCPFGYTSILLALGVYPLELPTHPVTGIDKEAVRNALKRDNVKAAILQPNFGNPLGGTIPEKDRKELTDMFQERGAVILEDDIYGDLPHKGERGGTLYQYNRESVIYISSFCKTLAPGYQVAWLCTEKYLDQVFKYKALTTVDSVRPSQIALAEYLASGKFSRQIRKLRAASASLIGLFTNAVTKYFPEGTRITRPKGGFLLWIELPESVDTLAVYQQASYEGISFVPGTVFSSQDKYNNCMRINCAVEWNNETEAYIRRLGELCQKGIKI